MKNQLYCLTELQQLKGGGEFLWLLHEVLYKSKLLEGAWQLSPYLKTFCVFLIAARNKPSIKNTSGFRGFILGLAVRLNNSPNRCKTLAALPDWAIYWGKLVAENKKIPLEMRGKGLWENGMNVACVMEMSISLKLCGAEVYACNESGM